MEWRYVPERGLPIYVHGPCSVKGFGEFFEAQNRMRLCCLHVFLVPTHKSLQMLGIFRIHEAVHSFQVLGRKVLECTYLYFSLYMWHSGTGLEHQAQSHC